MQVEMKRVVISVVVCCCTVSCSLGPGWVTTWRFFPEIPRARNYWPLVFGRLFLGTEPGAHFVIEVPSSGDPVVRSDDEPRVLYDNGEGSVVMWVPIGEAEAPGHPVCLFNGKRFVWDSSERWTINSSGRLMVLVEGEEGQAQQKVSVMRSGGRQGDETRWRLFVPEVQKVLVDDHGWLGIVMRMLGVLLLRVPECGDHIEVCGVLPLLSVITMAGSQDSVGFVIISSSQAAQAEFGLGRWDDRKGFQYVPWIWRDPTIGAEEVSDVLCVTETGAVVVVGGRLAAVKKERAQE